MKHHGPDPRTGSGPFSYGRLPGTAVVAAVFLSSLWLGAAPVAPRIEAIARGIDEVVFASEALGREMKLSVVHPAVETFAFADRPVLYLLHGRGRHNRSLIDLPESRQQLLTAGCWIVLPDGEDGWYLNSPVDPTSRYSDYLEEVIRLTSKHYGFSSNPRRRAIAGWSMGGYGAIRFVQTHPEDFGVVASVIGVLDFPREETLPPGQNYQVPVARFGDNPAVWNDFNPRNSVGALRGKSILLITADEAFDRTMNENFSTALRAAGIDHEFCELSGRHTLPVVQAALPKVLEFVCQKILPTATP